MNIIACSYTNLGPFANKTISLVVHPWAAMIIAPVGTGKSMLFFDWPVYGLYKYGTRDVLNNACDTGSISMLIEINNEYWLIRRQLKASKTRSISTTSSLARYHGDVSSIYNQYPEILYADRDIIAELDPISIDEIVFKNETDLQKNLEEFLPARDVFMNRDMLMQESSNIFDLTQTERITVFKHLFGLLDIDSAKDRLWEEKTKLKYLLQVKKDTSSLSTKLTGLIAQLKQQWNMMTRSDYYEKSDLDKWLSQWLDDSSLLGTDIAFDTLLPIDRVRSSALDQALEWHKNNYHTVVAQLSQAKIQEVEFVTRNSQLAAEFVQITKELEQIAGVIQTYNGEQLQELKSDKLLLIQQINEIEFGIDYDVFDEQVEDMVQAYEYVTKLTQQGKELQLQIAHIDTQIKALQDTEALQTANQKSQIVALDEQLSQLGHQIVLKEEKLWIASRFYCVKIDADCPFISQINDGVIASHTRELDQIKSQYDTILTTRNSLPVHSVTDYPAHLQRLNGQKESLQSQITKLRELLIKIWFKQITEQYPIYQQLQLKLKTVDGQIVQFEHKLAELDQLRLKEQMLQIQLSQWQVQETELQTKNEELKILIEQLVAQEQKLKGQYEQIKVIETWTQQVTELISRINDLIHEYKTSQLEIVTLETRAKRVDELYTIVSKELTVIVLQEYLPVLSDIINNQLSKVVNYQLEFTVNAGWDKLEIMIKDEYGSREVKSLSGWQRAVLRLCWILAIALWSGNKFLFLDETINHLDKEMVSKAAELIEEFVQWNKVTLYAITHSDQIQELDIWDYVVRVKDILG